MHRASVRLQLRGGARLSREAIAGIRAFVAASVPELQPARVTILDDRGVAFGDETAGADEAADLQRSLQSALDFAFGDGATIVRVRAEYEAAQTSEHDVRRAPIAVAAIGVCSAARATMAAANAIEGWKKAKIAAAKRTSRSRKPRPAR